MDCIATEDKTFQASKTKVRTPLRRVRLWTRLSPAHLLRVFVDNYVKGCVTFANDSEADAHASSFTVTLSRDDHGASHPRHAHGIASARELNLDLSNSKISHSGSVQGSVQGSVLAGSVHLAHKHHAIITGSSMADVQGQYIPLHKVGASGRGADSGALDAVPKSRSHTKANGLEALFQTSALHPTEFLQSASRRGAAFGTHLVPRGGGSGRMLRRPRSRSASSALVSPVAVSARPLSPVTDMSTFREQSRRRKPSRRPAISTLSL